MQLKCLGTVINCSKVDKIQRIPGNVSPNLYYTFLTINWVIGTSLRRLANVHVSKLCKFVTRIFAKLLSKVTRSFILLRRFALLHNIVNITCAIA